MTHDQVRAEIAEMLPAPEYNHRLRSIWSRDDVRPVRMSESINHLLTEHYGIRMEPIRGQRANDLIVDDYQDEP